MFTRIIAAAAIVGFVWAPMASADDGPDAKYLAALAARGIPADADAGQLIADAHAACDTYGTPGVVGLMLGIEARGLSPAQAGYVMTDGMRAYCPTKSPF